MPLGAAAAGAPGARSDGGKGRGRRSEAWAGPLRLP